LAILTVWTGVDFFILYNRFPVIWAWSVCPPQWPRPLQFWTQVGEDECHMYHDWWIFIVYYAINTRSRCLCVSMIEILRNYMWKTQKKPISGVQNPPQTTRFHWLIYLVYELVQVDVGLHISTKFGHDWAIFMKVIVITDTYICTGCFRVRNGYFRVLFLRSKQAKNVKYIVYIAPYSICRCVCIFNITCHNFRTTWGINFKLGTCMVSNRTYFCALYQVSTFYHFKMAAIFIF
jgi:hypothetical protein